jgi:hypothetical protein
MNKILFIILLTINCLATPQLKYEINGDSNNICENKIGKEKIKCISNILDNYEKIINATPKVEVLSEKRASEDIVVVIKRYCLEDLCFQVKEEKYSPTMRGKIKNYLLTGSLSFLIGVVTGFTLQ